MAEDFKPGDSVMCGRKGPFVIQSLGSQPSMFGPAVEVAIFEDGSFAPLGKLKVAIKEFSVGSFIQHASGSGPVFEILKARKEHGDMLAATLGAQPEFTRVINLDNWKAVERPDAA